MRMYLLAVAVALAGCSGGEPASNVSGDAASPLPDNASPVPVKGAAATTGPAVDGRQANGEFAASSGGEAACSAEIGMAAARKLVDQCRNVSPATHPPCNVANSCALIRSEVKRGCGFFDADDPKTPKYCAAYR